MKVKLILSALLVFLFSGLTADVAFSSEGLPEYLVSKGGVLYPRTGDSTQEIFRTQPEVMNYLKPGMLIGVLPADCISASHGALGEIYRCHYDLSLKAEELGGRTVYRVLDRE